MLNETFCGTKNDLETPSPTTVGKEPETGTTTAVGNPNPTDPRPTLVTGGSLFPPGTPFATTPTSSLPGFDPKDTTSVTFADVDGDGDEDIVVTTVGGKPTEVYLNPGNGDFSGVQPSTLGPPGLKTPTPDSSSVKVIDVNGDGTPDLVLGNKDGQNDIYLGDPSNPGKFASEPLKFGAPGDVTTDVEVVDVDGDGAVDIVVANNGQPNKVYYGDPALPTGGTPSYGTDPTKESTLGTGSGPSTSIELADLNGDGRLDILVGNDGARDEIFMGAGAPGVRQPLAGATPIQLYGTALLRTSDIKVGDVTGDGLPDIVVASIGENNLLYPGQTGAVPVSTTPTVIGSETDTSMSVDLVDTDGDGDLDVVFGNSDATASTYVNNGGVLSPTPIVTGKRSTESDGVQHVADFNGDGIPDLVTGTDIVLGDGTGDFSAGQRVPYNMGDGVQTPLTVTSMDIDNDGDIDLVVSPRDAGPFGHSTPYYLLNPGSGDFSKAEMHRLGGPQPNRQTKVLTPMDLNGDGLMDMLLGNANGNAEVWMNPGPAADPNSAATYELPSSVDASDFEVVDVNKDGLKDIVMVLKSSGVVRTILNPGTVGVPSSVGASAIAWSTAPGIDVRPPAAPRQVEMVDVNKDGHLDMVVGTSASLLVYLGSTGSSSTGRIDTAPIVVGSAASVPPLDVQDLDVADVNGDGWPDLVCSYDPAVYDAATSPHHKRIFYGSGSIGANPVNWASAPGARLGPPSEAEWDIKTMDIVDLNGDGESGCLRCPSAAPMLWPSLRHLLTRSAAACSVLLSPACVCACR